MTSPRSSRWFTFGLRELFLVVTSLAAVLAAGLVAGPIWTLALLVFAAIGCLSWRAWRRERRVFRLWHVGVLLAFWLIATLMTYAALDRGLTSSDRRQIKLIAVSVASFTGPMTGALSRDMQGCCLEFSLTLLPYSLTGFGLAVLAQLVLPTGRWYWELPRIVIWLGGCLVWFGSGLLSLGHALS